MFPIATTPHVCMYYWLLVLAKFQTDFDDISVDRDYEQFDEQTAQELIESKVCLYVFCLKSSLKARYVYILAYRMITNG